MLLIPGLIKRDLLAVEKKLGVYARKTENILPGVKNFIMNRGKRIRPSLLLLSYRLFKGINSNGTLKHAINTATIVELLHTASLFHDDVIEGAGLRRGRRTLNAALGDKTAVLVGDLLSAFSTSIVFETKNFEVLKAVSKASTLICEGEIEDVVNSFNSALKEKQYFVLIRKKTAALFTACSEIGGIIAGAGPRQIRAMRNYGLNLGIAFQVVDDILDYTAAEKEFGKPVLSDLKEGKITLPIIYALKKAGKVDRDRLLCVISNLKNRKPANEAMMKEVKSILLKYDCLTRSYKSALKYVDKAKHSLKRLPDNEFKLALIEIASFVIKREF
ncbi:MAG: polyprenyl synthetase family protein [Candidatus Firestonebacteria bacterium]